MRIVVVLSLALACSCIGTALANSDAEIEAAARRIIAELLEDHRAAKLALAEKSDVTPQAGVAAPPAKAAAQPEAPSAPAKAVESKPAETKPAEQLAPATPAPPSEPTKPIEQLNPPATPKSAAAQNTKPPVAAPIDPITSQPPVEDVKAKRPAKSRLVPADSAKAAREVIDDLVAKNEEQQARDRREGLFLLEQAKSAKKGGNLRDAMRLVESARKLYADHPPIEEFAESLAAEIRTDKLASASHWRAKARLASALTRGQLLMDLGRFGDARDLLEGVVESSSLFPANANVEMYKRVAQRELDTYMEQVKTGKIAPAPKPGEPVEQPALVSASATPPSNLKRLLQGSESQVPAWYAVQKNRLTTTMSVNYEHAPLALVFDDISRAVDVPIIVDQPVALARAHVNANLDLRAGDLSAEMVLDIACMKAGLEYVIMEKSIVVTTPAKAIEYVRQLPVAVRQNWAVGRVLFPELNPEVYAAAPTQASVPANEPEDNLPAYLTSGKALRESIEKLLR